MSRSSAGTATWRSSWMTSGPGIHPADAAHLFDRFFRAERSRARDGRPGGAGLGLSIVAAVASAHDGSVNVDASPSGGARFTILLPAPAS